MFYYMYIPCFVYRFIHCWTFELLTPLGFVNSAVKMNVSISFQDPAFNSLDIYP